MNKLLLKIGVLSLLTLAIVLGAIHARKEMILNSSQYVSVSSELELASLKIIGLKKINDSLNVSGLNSEIRARAVSNLNSRLQGKLDTFTKYNKVCYQKVLVEKGFLKRKVWAFVEVQCSNIVN